MVSAVTYYNIPDTIGISLDGQGGVLSTGITQYSVISSPSRLVGWDLVASTTGSVVFDIWKITSGNTLPTVVNSIVGANNPQINPGPYSGSTNLGGWSGTTLNTGDIIVYNINNVSGITKATLTLRLLKQ